MTDEPKRMTVRDRKALHWPRTLGEGPRLNEDGLPRPYVIDWTDPAERIACKGQEYKLDPAPDDAKPTPIGESGARKNMAKLRGETPPLAPKTVAAQVAENADAAPEPVQQELPEVAPRPASKKASKKARRAEGPF